MEDQTIERIKTDCPRCRKKRAIRSSAYWGQGTYNMTGSWTKIRITQGCYRCGWGRKIKTSYPYRAAA